MSTETTVTTPSGAEPESPDVVVLKTLKRQMSPRKRIALGAFFVLVGALTVWGLGFGAKSGVTATFNLSAPDAALHVPDLRSPAHNVNVVLGALIVAVGVWQAIKGLPPRALRWTSIVVGVAFVFAFLSWAATGQQGGSTIDLLGLMQQSIFLSIPLILGSMAGILCERTAVINVAIEGQLLAGAFAGALFGSVTHNLGLGLVAAVVAGGLVSALLAVFAIRYMVNQIIVGVVINVLVLGLTGFIYDSLMQPNQDTLNNPGFFSPIAIPGLSAIPIVGPLLFDANIIVYLTYVVIIAVDVALLRTRWGLRTRAVGEHPKAADTVGINVNRTRYRNVILGGCVAGLGGAFITIGAVGAFTKNISSGKGFIALAAMIFGRWSPRGALAAALLFGFCDALATVLSFIQAPVAIPSNLLSMLPYLATLFAVAGVVGRVRAPAADGEPYTKG
ncbi:MAG TPA: ABC transporter permease [Segeticoccus sp.]|uniref:ABC transporter permease n=1 Tax=Segeticoccus sp. TaxID=2706531 RepID=UPI002D7EE0B6|nr:ABC transporter permease [Segeticoccus sp.]HET8601743.1 ABC transporter permease [Segeticoccus sp.]